jgi:hypothetical protein
MKDKDYYQFPQACYEAMLKMADKDFKAAMTRAMFRFRGN